MTITKEFIKKAIGGKIKWETDDSVSEMIQVSVNLKFDEQGASIEIYDLDGCLVQKHQPLTITNGDTIELGHLFFKIKVA